MLYIKTQKEFFKQIKIKYKINNRVFIELVFTICSKQYHTGNLFINIGL